MAFSLIVKPEAEEDLADAYHWYEKQRTGLGHEFFECVEDVFLRLRLTPEIHAIVHESVRQTLIQRFPYVVCYTIEEKTVYVIAVFHGHRDPKDWQSRA